jgi:hypothetical protein
MAPGGPGLALRPQSGSFDAMEARALVCIKLPFIFHMAQVDSKKT